jgi:dsRNA-specific ribonuclease
MTLPKMFADVFEALVAAVFLDSGHDLHTVRDVFMGPLLETIGEDALAYVCHSSGLSLSKYIRNHHKKNGKKVAMAKEEDEEMEELVFTDDDEEL